MERIEYRGVVDKSDWPRGEWDNEPDKIQWQDEATGLPCLIVRGPVGALCGYVGVPEGHPAFGKDYDAAYDLITADVHGGLTFADSCSHGREERGICHKPAPGESDTVWWLGFDCAHLGDICPSMDRRRIGNDPNSWYKNVAYVAGECRKLASQIHAVHSR